MSDQKTLSLAETKEKILELMRYVAEARFVSKRKEAQLTAVLEEFANAQQPASEENEIACQKCGHVTCECQPASVDVGYSVHRGSCPYEHGGPCTCQKEGQQK